MKKQILFLLVLAAFVSCDAPHLNPFDPENPDNNLGSVEGAVYLSGESKLPIANARITWSNQNVYSLSDSTGKFKLENLTLSEGWLFVEKDGMTKDSVFINWNSGKHIGNLEFQLSYRIGSFDGYVFTINNQRLANAKVYWKNQNKFSLTNEEGYYLIEDVQMEDGWIYFEKKGYAEDSVYLSWENRNKVRIDNLVLFPTVGQLDGYVYSGSGGELSDVKVYWKNQNLLVFTNSNGFYKFNEISLEDGWLIFEKEGYFADSVYVIWSGANIKHLENIFLSPSLGSIDGFVYSAPRNPASNVRVIWQNQNIITYSNSLGYYKLSGVTIKDGWIKFEKDGLSPDSVYVEWNGGNNIRAQEKILNYTKVRLYGYVRTLSLPRKPIPGVTVFWKNKSIITQTNSSGFYEFRDIEPENGWLYFEKDGYSNDSLYVEFSASSSKLADDKYLNSTPVLQNLQIYSSVQNKYPDVKNYRMIVQATITDNENDIDTVFAANNSLGFKKRLVFNPDNGYFENTFRTTDLKVASLEDLIGFDFTILVKDKFAREFNVGKSNIKRIINQEISIESPVNKAETGASPTFKWKRFTPGFKFRFKIQVYTDELSPILVWEKDNISKDAIEQVCETSLPAGDYYWVIWCVDDYNNNSISKPGTFTVK
jgi:hypothetical protein